VLHLVEMPVPVPGDGQTLIRVTRAGLNFADIARRQGGYEQKTLPIIPGVEVVGVREDTGERALALLRQEGGYAQYAVARTALTFAVPDGLSDETALALFEAGLTAYMLLHTSARMHAGESVAIHAAAGGVGSLAVQLARLAGAGRVIGIASTDDKRALVRRLGADAAIDGSSKGLTERLLEANLGRPIDVILEMVGGAVFDASFAALAPFGRLVVYGQASDIANTITTDALMADSRAVIGFWLKHCLEHRAWLEQALAAMFDLAAQGKLLAQVGQVYPLEEAASAQRDLESRRSVGKLMLDPWK
jgi:NADPH:quinone reductase